MADNEKSSFNNPASSKSDSEKVSIATPIQTIGTLQRVTQGLYSFKRASNRNDLAEAIGMDPSEVGKTFGDASDLGLMEKTNETGVYALTEQGVLFAQLLDYEREEDARELLASQILSAPAWSEIVVFLRVNVGKPRPISDLVLYAERKIGRKWGSGRRTKAERAYRTILSYAGLVDIEGSNIISTLPESPVIIQETPVTSSHLISQGGGSDSETIQNIGEIEDSETAVFSISGFFTISVLKNQESIRFLQKQIADGVVNSWLESTMAQLHEDVEN